MGISENRDSFGIGDVRMKHKSFWLCLATVGLGFTWTGSSYISHMYNLDGLFPPQLIDILALRWHYLAQAAGLLTCGFVLWRFPKTGTKKRFIQIIAADALFMVLALGIHHASATLWAGLVMNLLHGAVAAGYLTMLSAVLPPGKRGLAFGCGYALGSISTFLLSMFHGGNFIRSHKSIAAYLLIVGANCAVVGLGPDIEHRDNAANELDKDNTLTLGGLLIFMGTLSALGNHHQFQLISDAKVNLELSRAFYAIGLIIAGAVADKSREISSILCFASLAFPFVQITPREHPSLTALAWGLSYFVLGFFAVFRAIAFVDVAGGSPPLLPLAPFGLAAGRIGEAASTLFPASVYEDHLRYTLVALILFLPLTFLFFRWFKQTFLRTTVDKTTRLRRFAHARMLTHREQEVLEHVLSGLSNGKIGAKLFISESTVKFHVKNILRKTGCGNRRELVNLVHTQKPRPS